MRISFRICSARDPPNKMEREYRDAQSVSHRLIRLVRRIFSRRAATPSATSRHGGFRKRTSPFGAYDLQTAFSSSCHSPLTSGAYPYSAHFPRSEPGGAMGQTCGFGLVSTARILPEEEEKI